MTAPDPETVREIARTVGLMMVETAARNHIVHAAMLQHGISHDNVYAWSETYDRVLDELAAVLKPLTQPDEQQPANVVTAEQQQDEAAEDVTAFLDIWEAEHGSGSIRGGNADVPYLFSSDLCAVLAERAALAARVAKLESEREADARAALALLKLGEVLYLGQRPTDWADARRQLAARFADRIAALDATETEES